MSSRIIRRGRAAEGEPPDAQPIQWRPHGQPFAAQPSARAAGQSGGTDTPPADGEREKEIRAAAYQQGVAAGEAAAAQRAQARLEPALAAFQSMAAELAGMRENLRAKIEEAAVT